MFCTYIYVYIYIILEEASYLTKGKKSMIDILYTKSPIYIYTYTFKRVPMCARAYVRVRARTRGHCISSTHPSQSPISFFSSLLLLLSLFLLRSHPSLAASPTRYTHLRTYPLRITVAMLCRDVLNE